MCVYIYIYMLLQNYWHHKAYTKQLTWALAYPLHLLRFMLLTMAMRIWCIIKIPTILMNSKNLDPFFLIKGAKG